MSKDSPTIWLITDQKPGHLNQLLGLAQQLSAQIGAQYHFVNDNARLGLMTVWRGINLAPDLPTPDLIVSAGSGTQRALLASKRFFDKPAVLLMRPNFPYAWLDAAIVPEHDSPPRRDNVLVTRGVLNHVQPSAVRRHDSPGLVLIGGPSKHYGWDDAALVRQVQRLCSENPAKQWLLTDSRRTPASFLAELNKHNLPNLTCLSHLNTAPGWLVNQIAESAPVWVTPDSVSMVYEALTSGAPTGLLSLPDPVTGRIQAGLQTLISEGRVVTFEARNELQKLDQKPPLWEAKRAASWLAERFFPR
ncbi:mitochondrial fission ELM1 family protein [Simiduia curdlanivorans]|uniref:Mitochondrial fission ELM1 family protein n=1 Tax=Simiduia curdlanivorans TaxID=1492769 RepID=A0ABV8V1H2_9GAMM|nr:mitochondrial fission ELM1 family protein [Simiduia curdlanivorans]MDN3637925.1 mitochondrial fission ELM1 family protein [Simiduia curdlanivorans]